MRMIAIVSSMVSLLSPQPMCNGNATNSRRLGRGRPVALLSLCVWVTACLAPAAAQPAQAPLREGEQPHGSRAATALLFLGGAATALAIHEASHVAFDVLFEAHPGVKRVDYGGIPFFAITHEPVSRRREF